MIVIEEFDATKDYHQLDQFSCGHSVIDAFVVKQKLRKQIAAEQSLAWALLDTNNGDKFVGFYTLTMSGIAKEMLQTIFSGSLPKTIGCTRLVMLGVHGPYQGTPDKLGSRLVKHALSSTKQAAKFAHCRGMYLDADATALGFYKKLGFVELQPPPQPGAPTPMFMPIASIF